MEKYAIDAKYLRIKVYKMSILLNWIGLPFMLKSSEVSEQYSYLREILFTNAQNIIEAEEIKEYKAGIALSNTRTKRNAFSDGIIMGHRLSGLTNLKIDRMLDFIPDNPAHPDPFDQLNREYAK